MSAQGWEEGGWSSGCSVKEDYRNPLIVAPVEGGQVQDARRVREGSDPDQLEVSPTEEGRERLPGTNVRVAKPCSQSSNPRATPGEA